MPSLCFSRSLHAKKPTNTIAGFIPFSSLVPCTCASVVTSGHFMASQPPSASASATGLCDFSPDNKLVVVKIFTRVLVPDVEYKTLSINRTTTCREVIGMLLQKCRLRDRDPNLFFLTIDVWIRKTGIPIRSVMVLDEKTCPAQLQSVYPQQGTKFTLQMRRGGFLRCDDSCLTSSATLQRNLLLSDRTTAEQLIQLVLHCNHSQETPSNFCLYEVSRARNYERRLNRKELPLIIQQEWPGHDLVFFRLVRRSDPLNEGEDSLPVPRFCPWSRVIEETSSFGYKYKVDTYGVSPSGSNDSLSTLKSTGTATSSSSSAHSSGSECDAHFCI